MCESAGISWQGWLGGQKFHAPGNESACRDGSANPTQGRSKAKVFFGPEDALTSEGLRASGFCSILITNDTGTYFTLDSAIWN